MTVDLRTETVVPPDPDLPVMALDIPSSWECIDQGPSVHAAWSDQRSLNAGIATNIVLTAEQLPEGTAIQEWQTTVRAAQLASLPDLQILDDRLLTSTEDAPARWYRCTAMTDEQGTTVLTRRWDELAGRQGLTLTLTTLPLVDVEHGELLDAISASWRVTPRSTHETRTTSSSTPVTDPEVDDHADS